MTGIDTNVLLRYITGDDEKQSARAAEVLEALDEESPGFVNAVVLIEMTWALKAVYGYTREQIGAVISEIVAAPELRTEHVDCVWSALRLYLSSKCDFEDALIGRINVFNGSRTTLTFDRDAARKLPEFDLA